MKLLELIKEVFTSTLTPVMVLSFSNDNDVQLHLEDLDPQSKLQRRSKVRLDVDFSLVKTDGNLAIWKTYRGEGKNDYVVYVYNGESYAAMKSYMHTRSVSTKKVQEEYKQLRIKDVTKPNPDKTMHLYIDVESYRHCKYYSKCHLAEHEDIIFHGNSAVQTAEWKMRPYVMLMQLLYYAASPEFPRHGEFNEINIHWNDASNNAFLMCVNGIYVAKADWFIYYICKFDNIVNAYGKNGIGIKIVNDLYH